MPKKNNTIKLPAKLVHTAPWLPICQVGLRLSKEATPQNFVFFFQLRAFISFSKIKYVFNKTIARLLRQMSFP